MNPFDFGKHVAKFVKTAVNPWDNTANIPGPTMPGMPRVGYNTRTYQRELQPPPPTRRTATPEAPAWQTTMHSNAGSRGGMPSAQPSYDFSSGTGPVEMADSGYVSPTRGPESTPSTDLVLNTPSGAPVAPRARPQMPMPRFKTLQQLSAEREAFLAQKNRTSNEVAEAFNDFNGLSPDAVAPEHRANVARMLQERNPEVLGTSGLATGNAPIQPPTR